VKFLVDECLPARLIEVLSMHGHDAVHVSECGLNGKPDTEVMALAAAEVAFSSPRIQISVSYLRPQVAWCRV
jgi:predicted nuclease of predicted toxin-antitoxin system